MATGYYLDIFYDSEARVLSVGTEAQITYNKRNNTTQCAKKVMSDSPGLVDFVIKLVIFVLNLPNGQVLFFGKIQIYRRTVNNPANQKGFWG